MDDGFELRPHSLALGLHALVNRSSICWCCVQQGVAAWRQTVSTKDRTEYPALIAYSLCAIHQHPQPRGMTRRDVQSPCACLQDLLEALSAKDTWFIPRKYDQATWVRTPEGQYAGYEEIVPFGGPLLSICMSVTTHVYFCYVSKCLQLQNACMSFCL